MQCNHGQQSYEVPTEGAQGLGTCLQFKRPVGHELDAVFGDKEVLLESEARAEVVVVEAGLDSDKVALGQRIVPVGIQVRTFLWRESNAMTQMVIEDPRSILIELRLCFVE